MNSPAEHQGAWVPAPAVLLLGVVCAFVACCLAGRVVAARNPFAGFQRFHPHITPQTLFYPTASQVRALGRARLDRDRIAIVVGGSSVLRGFGQQPDELWTRHLQAQLGDGYRVLNLAMNGACPAEFGGTAAEMLAQDFPRLIFIGDIFPYQLAAPEISDEARRAAVPQGATYDWFFWDACCKGLLPADTERRQAVDAWLRLHASDTRLSELTRGLRVDAVVYSRDLWTGLAHDRFSTVWAPLLTTPFTRPRRMYADLDATLALVSRDVRYPTASAGTTMGLLRGAAALGQSTDLPNLEKAHALVFPRSLRGRTLLLAVRYSPYYEVQLSAAERAGYRAFFPSLVRGLEKLGFAALAVETDCGKEDFFDLCHLNESGGRKLAAKVAPAVRRLARRLGYEKDL